MRSIEKDSLGCMSNTLTFGFEAGVSEVVGLGFCLADFQLRLLKVLLLLLLPLRAGTHPVSRCRGGSSSFLLGRQGQPDETACVAATRDGRRREDDFCDVRLAANGERRPLPRQDRPPLACACACARSRRSAAPACCQHSPQLPPTAVAAHSPSCPLGRPPWRK